MSSAVIADEYKRRLEFDRFESYGSMDTGQARQVTQLARLTLSRSSSNLCALQDSPSSSSVNSDCFSGSSSTLGESRTPQQLETPTNMTPRSEISTSSEDSPTHKEIPVLNCPRSCSSWEWRCLIL